MRTTRIIFFWAVCLFALSFSASSALAKHKGVVIQVSTNDVKVINLAINNAFNLSSTLGVANIDIEIVAYGPGLAMFRANSPVADRLRQLYALGNVSFGICNNTITKMNLTRNDLLADAFVDESIVPGGVVRIMELQDEGWNYIRP